MDRATYQREWRKKNPQKTALYCKKYKEANLDTVLVSMANWRSKNKDMNTVYIYFIHLVFNSSWSIVFFVYHNIVLALVVLVILISLIIVLIIRFRRVKKMSSYLMVPYLLWTCFALILNTSLLILN